MGVNTAVMRQAVVMQMTWVGAPTLYYGDEAGVCGWTDPDNRRSYPWGREDNELIRFHKEMIRIHRDYQVFKTGSMLYLHSENGLIVYGRFQGEEKAVIAVQTGGTQREIQVDVWRLGLKDGEKIASMMATDQQGFSMEARVLTVKDGKVSIPVGENGAVLYKSIRNLI